MLKHEGASTVTSWINGCNSLCRHDRGTFATAIFIIVVLSNLSLLRLLYKLLLLAQTQVQIYDRPVVAPLECLLLLEDSILNTRLDYLSLVHLHSLPTTFDSGNERTRRPFAFLLRQQPLLLAQLFLRLAFYFFDCLSLLLKSCLDLLHANKVTL